MCSNEDGSIKKTNQHDLQAAIRAVKAGKVMFREAEEVYGFPEIRDICEFSTSQVVGKLEKPIPYGRGLFKFKYDCKSSS